MTPRAERHPFLLHPLTPVHVGTEAGWSPLEYVVAADRLLHPAGARDLARALAPQVCEELTALAGAATPLPELHRFIRGHFPGCGPGVPVSPQVWDRYRAAFLSPVEGGGGPFEVFPLTRDGFGLPYLPGSALKGAIRTAVLNELDQQLKPFKNDRPRSAGEAEALLLGCGRVNPDTGRFENNIGADPFAALWTADAPVAPENTLVVQAHSKNPRRPLPGAALAVEVFSSALLNAAETAPAPIPGFFNLLPARGGNRTAVTVGLILQSCNAFYRRNMDQEFSRFKPLLAACQKPIEGALRSLDPSRQCLLRLGRFTHFESKSLDSLRPNAGRAAGTARTLAEGGAAAGLPFGWAVLELVDSARHEAACEALRESRAKALEAGTARLAAHRNAIDRAARLKTLNPAQRLIEELPDMAPDASKGAFNVWKKLPKTDPDKTALAQKLKERWEQIGAWRNRDCGPDQREKVAKIKEYLGLE